MSGLRTERVEDGEELTFTCLVTVTLEDFLFHALILYFSIKRFCKSIMLKDKLIER